MDYRTDEFEEVVEARNKLHTFTDYYILNEDLIHIYQSSLPSYTDFSVLDLKNNKVEKLFSFKSEERFLRPEIPYKIIENKYILTLYDVINKVSSFTFFDISIKDTSKNYYEIPHGGKIDINNSKSNFISHSRSQIYLNDLTKYLAETSVENTEELERFLYPNPTTNIIQIKTCSFAETRIELFNINGIILKNEVLPVTDSLVTFDLSGFPSGSYFIRLNCGEEIRTYNVIKEN